MITTQEPEKEERKVVTLNDVDADLSQSSLSEEPNSEYIQDNNSQKEIR